MGTAPLSDADVLFFELTISSISAMNPVITPHRSLVPGRALEDRAPSHRSLTAHATHREPRASSKMWLLFFLIAAVAGYEPEFAEGSGWLSSCHKFTNVFGVVACFSEAAWTTSPAKCSHIANVMAQLLDNDEDGQVDDPDVLAEMLRRGAVLFVPATEDEMTIPPLMGQTQMSGLWEAQPNSCMVPKFRGASQTDPRTWGAARDTNAGVDTGAMSCVLSRDATFEEMLHLITESASAVYPDLWGQTSASKAGAAIEAANGNCGNGHSGNYINPSSTSCQGQYAYDDETCDSRCIIVEGIYWAVASFTGGLYTTNLAGFAEREWLMSTPDDSLVVLPEGVTNARSLESGSPALYALVKDTSSSGHAWLPAQVPTGVYNGTLNGGTTLPPTPPIPSWLTNLIIVVCVALILCCSTCVFVIYCCCCRNNKKEIAHGDVQMSRA